MALEITPVTPGGAEFTPTDVPTFMQIQANGVNLGEPTVSTLNFAAGLTATRGTGGSANKVDVSAAGGGGGGAAVAVFSIAGASTSTFSSAKFGDWSPATVVLANAIATWDDANKAMDIAAAGVYAVKMECKVKATQSGGSTSFPRDDILYGGEVDSSVIASETKLGFNSSALGLSGADYVQWVEDFTVKTTDPNTLVQPRIYCKCYNSNDGKDSNFSAVVTLTKLS